MKKAFKIIGIIAIIIAVIFGVIYFVGNSKLKKLEAAQKNADNIIQNLDNPEVVRQFPDKNFPDKAQILNLTKGMSQNCDWKNRDGKFVDFFTMKNVGESNEAAFIYEYYLKCDSLRFILTYNLDQEKPELFRFDIQGLEEPNDMIIYPEKQLKNRQ